MQTLTLVMHETAACTDRSAVMTTLLMVCCTDAMTSSTMSTCVLLTGAVHSHGLTVEQPTEVCTASHGQHANIMSAVVMEASLYQHGHKVSRSMVNGHFGQF